MYVGISCKFDEWMVPLLEYSIDKNYSQTYIKWSVFEVLKISP